MNGSLSLSENGMDQTFVGESPAMTCFMAYEDLLTGLRGRRVLSRVLKTAGDSLPPHLELLRFDLLAQPELHFWAAREAAQSDIIMLSLHGDGELPGAVKNWLGLCTCRNGKHGVALVASLDVSVRQSPERSPAVAHLRGVAARNGLSLFTHFGGVSAAAIRAAIQSAHRRLARPFRSDDSQRMKPDSDWAGWGINE